MKHVTKTRIDERLLYALPIPCKRVLSMVIHLIFRCHAWHYEIHLMLGCHAWHYVIHLIFRCHAWHYEIHLMQSHNSLSDQVFRPTGTLEYGYWNLQYLLGVLKYRILVAMQSMVKLEVLMACLHRKFGFCTNEFERIFDDIWLSIKTNYNYIIISQDIS